VKRVDLEKRIRAKAPTGTSMQRFTAIAAHGRSRSVLNADHPAAVEGRTIMPARVVHASTVDRLLKSGQNSRKIGKQVVKGKWEGMPLFTLTIEERKTCPRSCAEWLTCYGANMPWALRIIHDAAFERRLIEEIASLADSHPQGFGVRLHILGDFYSLNYVRIWTDAITRHRELHVFGFTAHLPGSEIGAAIFAFASANWNRFAIRFSNGGFSTMCAEVVSDPADTETLICPAQTHKTDCCATCGFCWQSQRSIAFLRH
jgi:hypothetical protein